MTQFNAPTYDVERPTGQCAFSGRKLQPGESYMAALVEVDPEPAAGSSGAARTSAVLGFKRLDVSMEAWQAGERPPRMFSYWRSTVAESNQKRRMFVDDDVLMNLFRRLADTDQPQRLAFRFVLALILMRKRLLKYETSKTLPGAGEAPGREIWTMSAKSPGTPGSSGSSGSPGSPGTGVAAAETFEVLNPRLDDTQIQQVTKQLGEVLETEL